MLKKQLYKKVLALQYLTIAWNVIEGVVTISVGILTGSVSLFAFGLESWVEVFSSLVAVWELKGIGTVRRKSALKMISLALLVVAIYIAVNAIDSFIDGHHAKPTSLGMAYMASVTVVMFILGSVKRQFGHKMKNPVILAESNFTILDSALSGSILVGLLLNAWLGWWWTDQLLALLIAGNAFREGLSGVLESFKRETFLAANEGEIIKT